MATLIRALRLWIAWQTPRPVLAPVEARRRFVAGFVELRKDLRS